MHSVHSSGTYASSSAVARAELRDELDGLIDQIDGLRRASAGDEHASRRAWLLRMRARVVAMVAGRKGEPLADLRSALAALI